MGEGGERGERRGERGWKKGEGEGWVRRDAGEDG